MKIIFFAFKHRYRFKDLNNFRYSRYYGKYFLLNLGGPLKHWLAKILIRLKIGLPISCDGRPLVEEKSGGVNFFIRGTSLNIPTNFRDLKNNAVSITHPFLDNKDVLQIYPLDIKKKKINTDLKLIYMSSINIDINNKEEKIWMKYKKNILDDFTLIDKISFWNECLPEEGIEIIHHYYRIFKLLIRFEIVKHLKEKFKEKFILIGNDWKKYSIDSLPTNYNYNKNNNIYGGNVCLDPGSAEGSSSLYSRSNQIIESGGLIVQTEQYDSKNHWKELTDKILFKDFSSLDKIIQKLLDDRNYSNNILNQINNNFLNSNKLMENSFDKFLNKS